MSKRRRSELNAVAAEQTSRRNLWKRPELFAIVALVLTFLLYAKTLAGPFLFDDIGLPFYQLTFAAEPLRTWVSGVRPLLMFTYWVNYQVSARDPWSYHALNICFHAINSCLVFVLFSRVLALADVDRRRAFWCALTGALIFLIHPLQTESVAYIAGRSELLCGVFTLALLVIFCAPAAETISRGRALALVVFYGCAVLAKEQAAVLPALLLPLDMVLRRRSLIESLRKGVWLYAPLAAVGAIAVAGIAFLLAGSVTAGFRVPGIHWYEYLFTQCRVWLIYLRLSVFPFGQSADYDLSLSHTLAEHGAWIAALVLAGAALLLVRARERFPLVFCGGLIFTILLLPTSSVVPLQDVAAERRMYLPLAGLILAGLQFLLRERLPALTSTVVVALGLIFALLTAGRAAIWSNDIALWSEVTRSAPQKLRGHTQLAYAYLRVGRCREATNVGLRAPAHVQQSAIFMAILGQAYACDHRLPEAADAYERAVLLEPSVGRMLALASIYRKANRTADADAVELQALKLPPRNSYDQTMLRANFRSRSAPQQAPTNN